MIPRPGVWWSMRPGVVLPAGWWRGIGERAVKPIGLRVVAQAAAATGLPIMGMGGVTTWEDAAEYIAIGTGIIRVCTAVMARGFSVLIPMLKGLDAYLSQKGWRRPKPSWGRLSRR